MEKRILRLNNDGKEEALNRHFSLFCESQTKTNPPKDSLFPKGTLQKKRDILWDIDFLSAFLYIF